MCGLAGVFDPARRLDDAPVRLAERMAVCLAHRGPDDAGVWDEPAAGLAFGHRRLAIVDLSPLGHQPMASATGRFVIAYNGEIYGHEALRRELEGQGHLPGRSDTEVILAAIERWGVVAALPAQRHVRAGGLGPSRTAAPLGARPGRQEPLYLALHRDALLFASELKSLRTVPGFVPDIDRRALSLYLRFGYVPDPLCIYRSAIKLPAGTHLVLGAEDLQLSISFRRANGARASGRWVLSPSLAARSRCR